MAVPPLRRSTERSREGEEPAADPAGGDADPDDADLYDADPDDAEPVGVDHDSADRDAPGKDGEQDARDLPTADGPADDAGARWAGPRLVVVPDPDEVPVDEAERRGWSRRQLLAGAGGLVAAFVVGVAEPRPPAAPSPAAVLGVGAGGDAPPEDPVLPAAYTRGAATATLLARSGPHLLAPRGTFRTPYVMAAPGDDTTWDLRQARFLAYYDKDALYQTGEFADGSTEHQRNNRPIELGRALPVGGAALVGGLVEGDQPPTLTWERMKYGQDVQDDTDAWVDAGRPRGVDPHSRQVGNDNQDGDPRVYIKPGSWAVWDGVRIRNSHDGIGLYRRAPADGAGTCFIRNCWLQGIRDDAIENDDWHDLHVVDTLVDGTYTFLSALQEGSMAPSSRQSITVESSVVRLRPFPGGYTTRSTESVHGRIYKMRVNSPALVLRDTVIACERFRSPAEVGARLPTRRGRVTDVYEDVTLVWLGSGPYPGNVPRGCRVTRDAAVYRDAVADWEERHGVRDGGSADPARMLHPVPAPALLRG